jgi:hypothetical protein
MRTRPFCSGESDIVESTSPVSRSRASREGPSYVRSRDGTRVALAPQLAQLKRPALEQVYALATAYDVFVLCVPNLEHLGGLEATPRTARPGTGL